MPGLVPGIHVFGFLKEDVDGRDKPGHDELKSPRHIELRLARQLRNWARPFSRHARTRSGHPRLALDTAQDVDARHKAGHDGVHEGESRAKIRILRANIEGRSFRGK